MEKDVCLFFFINTAYLLVYLYVYLYIIICVFVIIYTWINTDKSNKHNKYR